MRIDDSAPSSCRPPVIAHDDGIGPRLHGQAGILRVEDALDDEFAAPLRADALHLGPVEPRIELLVGPGGQRGEIPHIPCMADDVAEGAPPCARHAPGPAQPRREIGHVAQRQPGRRGQAVVQILVPLPEDLQIQRQHQRRTARRLGPGDDLVDKALILHDIELEPEGLLGDMLGHVLDRADGHRGQDEGNPEAGSGPGGLDLAIRRLHPEAPDRREAHGHRHPLAQHGRGERAVRHVHRDALAKAQAREIGGIVAKGLLRPGSRFAVIVEHARRAPAMEALEIGNLGDDGHGGFL